MKYRRLTYGFSEMAKKVIVDHIIKKMVNDKIASVKK